MIKFDACYTISGMKLATYVKKQALMSDRRITAMLDSLGGDTYPISSDGDVLPLTDAILSIGGDGTFLSAATIAAKSGVPVLGVNLGRLGFLSENKPEDVAAALAEGEFEVEEREMLRYELDGVESGTALNEISVCRSGAAMLGIDVSVDGTSLPTIWADGLLVATCSGSTAYSLSVGGPICTPDAGVLVIAPIAPHNLNVRPLVVPSSAVIGISLRSRDDSVLCSADNRRTRIPKDSSLRISLARFSLKRIRLGRSNFISALQEKLFWGEDVRNGAEE